MARSTKIVDVHFFWAKTIKGQKKHQRGDQNETKAQIGRIKTITTRKKIKIRLRLK